jgi:outer membrane lipoprotein LolB
LIRDALARGAALPLGLVLGALLAGCAGMAVPPSGPSVSGRILVRVETLPVRSLSAGFELSGTPEDGRLALSSPLGSVLAEARWTPTAAVLTTPDGSTRHADIDSLAADALGERIPIAALYDWLRGRPWAQAPALPLAGGAAGFEQLGWRIDLGRFASGLVEARRERPPVVSLRAQVERAQ